jgi:predicted enzyme related to lactoylglutathione lyase
MIANIASVSVYVADQARAKTFWLEKAGFRLVREIPMGPDGSWLEVEPAGGGAKLVIYPRTYMKNWETMRPSIMFECDDIFAAYARMKENGVEFLSGPVRMKWGTFAQFLDSEGYVHYLREKVTERDKPEMEG